MIVAGSASPLLLSSGGYNLTKSLRFRSSASAYLNKTPASAGNRKTFTFSAWVKRAKLELHLSLFLLDLMVVSNIPVLVLTAVTKYIFLKIMVLVEIFIQIQQQYFVTLQLGIMLL